MSATEASRRASEADGHGRVHARPFLWSFTLSWISLLGFLVFAKRETLAWDFRTLLAWVLLDAVVNFLPLKGWQSAPFAADDPVILAAALIFPPTEVAIIIFLGASDPREFRRGTPLSKLLANRSQLSFCWFMGSLAVHTLTSIPTQSSLLFPLAFVGMGVAWVLNYGFVAFSISLDRGYRMPDVIRRLKIGASSDFILTFVAWCVLATMLVALYARVGNWALLAFLAPTLLGRQVLERSQESVDAMAAYHAREIALKQLARQIDQERTDERRLIAADLHDEVLQPLFKVTLMAQVVKNDLLNFNVLEAERDLFDLAEAADLATETLRSLVGDLRRSGLGRGGLSSALARLADVAREETTSTIQSSFAAVSLESLVQLALYQIAKEALGNAVHHARAANIWLQLRDEPGVVLLEVRDDGTGFDPYTDRPGHFGMHIMQERAAAIGAHFYVDSSPSQGTVVRVLVDSNSSDTR